MFRLLLPTRPDDAGDRATAAAREGSDAHDAFCGIVNATVIGTVVWLATLAVWLLST